MLKAFKKNLWLLLVASLLSGLAEAQPSSRKPDASNQYNEDTLKVLLLKTITEPHDFQRLGANHAFKELLIEALKQPGAFQHPFDSLKYISKIYSPDKRFRIFSWYVELPDGLFENFGILHVYNERRKQYEVKVMQDQKKQIKDPEFQTLKAENWYGAVYYAIIHQKHNGRDTYTLLGYDGNNKLSSRKVIEVMRVTAQGEPTFGYTVFRFDKNKHKRIIFEYSARVSMSLKFEKQFAEQGKKRKEMIVFDRLAPMHESLKGQFMFYMPETNVFDGFIFEDGRWQFIKDVDARNPRQRNKPKPIRWSLPE